MAVFFDSFALYCFTSVALLWP